MRKLFQFVVFIHILLLLGCPGGTTSGTPDDTSETNDPPEIQNPYIPPETTDPNTTPAAPVTPIAPVAPSLPARSELWVDVPFVGSSMSQTQLTNALVSTMENLLYQANVLKNRYMNSPFKAFSTNAAGALAQIANGHSTGYLNTLSSGMDGEAQAGRVLAEEGIETLAELLRACNGGEEFYKILVAMQKSAYVGNRNYYDSESERTADESKLDDLIVASGVDIPDGVSVDQITDWLHAEAYNAIPVESSVDKASLMELFRNNAQQFAFLDDATQLKYSTKTNDPL